MFELLMMMLALCEAEKKIYDTDCEREIKVDGPDKPNEDLCENKPEPEPEEYDGGEEPDDIEDFPIGYLGDMYYVQVDSMADKLPRTDATRKRVVARYTRDENEDNFLDIEDKLMDLFTIPGVDRECMKFAIQDYCEHLCEYLNED